LRVVADVDLESFSPRRDRQPLIAELTDDVKRLADRLLEREAERIRRDRALDLRTHVSGGLEKAICRDESVERLVRPLEVVVRQVVRESVLRVDSMGEYRATQKLVPQGLPEALDLAERLRMLWPASDVVDAHPRERLLEFRLSAPHRVLPTVVGQNLGRLVVGRHAAFEGLHHQRRLLVVRECVSDDESTVVVHEHAHVQPLCASEPKREDVRLPQLIRRRAFESTRPVLARLCRCRCLDEAFVVEDAPYLLLRDTECLEAGQYVPDASRSPLLVFALQPDHLFTNDRIRCPWCSGSTTLRLQRRRTLLPERCRPLLHRRCRHPERLRDVGVRRAFHSLLDHQQLVLGGHLSPGSPFSLRVRHPVSCSADPCQRFGEDGAR
jgi:hypothetical protein